MLTSANASAIRISPGGRRMVRITMFASCHASVCLSTLVTWRLARRNGTRKRFVITLTQPSISGSPSQKPSGSLLSNGYRMNEWRSISCQVKNSNNSRPASPGDLCSCSCVLCCVELLTYALHSLLSLFPLLHLLPRFLPCPLVAPSKMLHLSCFFPIRRCCLLSPTSQLYSCWITVDGLVASNIKLQSHLSCTCSHGCSAFSLRVSTTHLCHLSQSFCHGWQFGPLGFYRPWKPIRRQHWGFGIPMLNRHIIADLPPMDQLIHFIWQFLKPRDRRACADASILWNFYAKVCSCRCPGTSFYTSWTSPTSSQTRHSLSHPLSSLCIRLAALSLCLWWFHLLAQWWVHQPSCNWDNTYATLQQACVRPPPPSLPPVSFFALQTCQHSRSPSPRNLLQPEIRNAGSQPVQ